MFTVQGTVNCDFGAHVRVRVLTLELEVSIGDIHLMTL